MLLQHLHTLLLPRVVIRKNRSGGGAGKQGMDMCLTLGTLYGWAGADESSHPAACRPGMPQLPPWHAACPSWPAWQSSWSGLVVAAGRQRGTLGCGWSCVSGGGAAERQRRRGETSGLLLSIAPRCCSCELPDRGLGSAACPWHGCVGDQAGEPQPGTPKVSRHVPGPGWLKPGGKEVRL